MTVPTTGAAWRLAVKATRADAVLRRGITSLVDQALVSGTSFLTTLILARTCMPDELGLYALGFSLFVLLLNIPKALIWIPYTTFTPSMADEDRRLYGGSALALQMLACTGIGLLVWAVGVGVTPGVLMPGLAAMLRVLGPVLALMLLREYARQICFARLHAGEALIVDLVVAVLQTAGILLLATSGTLTAVRAYMVVGAASLPVVAVWIFAHRHTIELRRDRVAADFVRNFHFARLVFAGAMAQNIWWAMCPWALSFMHGASAAGIYSAAQNILFLANPVIISFCNFFGPHLAHVHAKEGTASLYRLTIKAGLAVTLLTSVFTIFAVVWGGDILVLLFGGAYAGHGAVVISVVIGEIFELITIPVTLALLALGRGDILLKSHLIRLAIGATIGLYCIHLWGPVGVGWARLISNFGGGLLQWWLFHNLVKDARSS